MTQLLNYFAKKIIRYRKFILNIIFWFCLLFSFLFLYNHLYQPLADIADIYSLKGKTGFTALNQELIDKTIDNLKEKTQSKKEAAASSPFD